MEQTQLRGIDLSSHRSTTVQARDIEQADLIFAMEGAHIVALRTQFKVSSEKLFLLGCCTPAVPIEIKDPYMLTGDAADQVFCQLDQALTMVGSIVSQQEQ